VPWSGDFNVDNLLTVIAILLDWGSPRQVTRALARVHAAPGRMETFGGGTRRSRWSTTRTRRTRCAKR
jgi:UDP-N-acetylmuramyl tripeptide synthase